MSKSYWVISDTHFGHENIIKYCSRPFNDAYEMDEHIIDKWNSVVKESDHIYHLGDVWFNKLNAAYILKRLKGRKRLIVGNHDEITHPYNLNSFDKIVLWRKLVDFKLLLTHVPVLDSCLDEKTPINIHGHIHNNYKIGSQKYFNVSCEVINYTPVNLEELRDGLF